MRDQKVGGMFVSRRTVLGDDMKENGDEIMKQYVQGMEGPAKEEEEQK